MAEAAATCVRVLDSSSDGASDGPLHEAAERLQSWAVAPSELESSVPDGEWFQHVLPRTGCIWTSNIDLLTFF